MLDAFNDALADRVLPVKVSAKTINASADAASAYVAGLTEADITISYDHATLCEMARPGTLMDLSELAGMHPGFYATATETDWATGMVDGVSYGYPLLEPTTSLNGQFRAHQTGHRGRVGG